MASEQKFTAKKLAEKKDLLMPGHRACAGCGPAITYRQILKATRGPTIATNATGCMEVVSTIYPYTAWRIPWIHTAFENVAANASGIEAALKVMRKKGKLRHDHIDIIAFAGDGGTYDIGIQALSGAAERGHDFLYVLYDNEAYMNTGIQRSGGTPRGAWTTTTPAGKVIPGKIEFKKPITEIMVAHGIPYVATASPANWRDLITKARKGLEVKGTAFLHVLSPCPRGWRYDTGKTIEIASLAVDTCVFPLWEAINGKYHLSAPSKVIALKPNCKRDITEYLKVQGRFRHLFIPENEYIVNELQKSIDDRWRKLLDKCGLA